MMRRILPVLRSIVSGSCMTMPVSGGVPVPG
jgi:hypothetical protein